MRVKSKKRPKSIADIILISLILIGLAVIAIQIYIKITDVRLRKTAVYSTAIIVDIDTRLNQTRENLTEDAFHHNYTYKYIVNGSEYFKTFQSGGNLLAYYQIGDEIQIYYSESAPQNARRLNETDYWLPLTLLSANMIFWISFARFRSNRKHPQKHNAKRRVQ